MHQQCWLQAQYRHETDFRQAKSKRKSKKIASAGGPASDGAGGGSAIILMI
jgi:hypothetical protein